MSHTEARVMAGRRHVVRALLLMPVMLLLAACGRPAPGRVFVDGYGRCPLQMETTSPVCALSKGGNVEFAVFRTPARPWGVAYAFNCGRRSHGFVLRVRLPELDASVAGTAVWRHGRQGQGWMMEADAAEQAAHQFGFDGAEDDIQLQTTCAFRVRAVLGPAEAVRAAIPAIPSLVPMNTGKILIYRAEPTTPVVVPTIDTSSPPAFYP